MPFGPNRGKSPTRAVYAGLDLPRVREKGRLARRAKRTALIALLTALGLLVYLSACLRSLSSGTALSDAQDLVTVRVNETIRRVLAEKGFTYGDFVTLEKDADGVITAITTDTAKINLLASELQVEIAKAAENGQLDVSIPLGDLLGAGVVQGRGPRIPVRVGMMTSSFLRFENGLVSTGINQSRHTLTLAASVEIDLLIPWGSMHTSVETEIPVAETVIVGRVPGTYFDFGAANE